MTGTPLSPKLLKGGIAVVDATSGVVKRIIAMQYNPDLLTRTLQPQGAGETGERSEALRLKGPPVETYKLDAEIEAADGDALTSAGLDPANGYGVAPQLTALEMLVYPTSAALENTRQLASQGILEIAAAETPLTLFVWNRTRIVPVRITEFSVTEEAFDPDLNPIRAKISLGMRVLSVNDLGFDHRGGGLYLNYQREKEKLAGIYHGVALSALGIGGIG
jgi:hypothetical protein